MKTVLVLDNIRSVYNVGSMFRTADGFGVEKLYLCGITAPATHPKMQKVALGAELSVPNEHVAATWRAVDRLKREGYKVVGLELGTNAVAIEEFAARIAKRRPRKLAIVVGNEVDGLKPALAKRLHALVEIPMRGTKESFNVAVACGIALYALK